MKKITLLVSILLSMAIITSCTMSAPSKSTKTAPVTGTQTAAPKTTVATSAQQPTSTTAPLANKQPAVTSTQPPPTSAVEAPTATLPPPTATPVPPSPVTEAVRIQPQPVGVAASVRGELNTGATTRYVIQVGASQILNVNVWSPNGDVYLAISGANDGKELVNASVKATHWNGAVPASQDYVFVITAGDGTTSYSIDVVIGAAATATQTAASQQATATSAATASTTRFDPYTAYGSPRMSDPMNGGNVTDWLSSDGSLPDTDDIKMYVEDAKFYVTGKRPGWSGWWFSWASLKDFFMEVTFKSGTCSGLDAYGMILRGPAHEAGKSSGYITEFSCDGSYQLLRMDSANPYSAVTLVGWTKNDHISTGSNQTNVMGIKADGKTLTLFANGYQIAQVTDETYTQGRYGLFVGPADTKDLTYRVVKMAYWLLAK